MGILGIKLHKALGARLSMCKDKEGHFHAACWLLTMNYGAFRCTPLSYGYSRVLRLQLGILSCRSSRESLGETQSSSVEWIGIYLVNLLPQNFPTRQRYRAL